MSTSPAQNSARSAHPAAATEGAQASSDAHDLTAPAVVLDSNVVFDWLVFRQPAVQPLVAALAAGRLRWLVTQAMLDELGHVLGRGVLARWQPDPAELLATCARWARACPVPAPQGEANRLRCRDGDDQKFIDLALAERATWLVSRDKALLALAGRARRLGLQILTPEGWAAGQDQTA